MVTCHYIDPEWEMKVEGVLITNNLEEREAVDNVTEQLLAIVSESELLQQLQQ